MAAHARGDTGFSVVCPIEGTWTPRLLFAAMKSRHLFPLLLLSLLGATVVSAMTMVASSPPGSIGQTSTDISDVYDNYMESYHVDGVPLIGNWAQNAYPEMHCSYINSMMANDMIDAAYSDANRYQDPNTAVYVGTVTRQDGNHMWVVVFIVRGGSTVAAYTYDVWTGTQSTLTPTEYAPGQTAYYVPEVGYVAPTANDLSLVTKDGPWSTVDGKKIRYGDRKSVV